MNKHDDNNNKEIKHTIRNNNNTKSKQLTGHQIDKKKNRKVGFKLKKTSGIN